MGLSRYLNLAKSWRDVVNEFRWRLSPDCSTQEVISFPIDREKLSNFRIRWPRVYQWAPAHAWVDHIKIGLKQFVPVEQTDIPQPYKGIVLIQVVSKGTSHDVAIDYSDYMERIEEDCLEQCMIYFKMQYLRQGYGKGRHEHKIIPGGFVNANPMTYKYLSRARAIRANGSHIYEVYGRFNPEFGKDIRTRAVQLLQNQNEFWYEGGLKKVRFSRSLLEVAQSKICIDLPGLGDFCFRLVDYLAVGACIIGPRHRTTLHVPLEDRKHIVYTKDDLSDLVTLCSYYLKNDNERERIRRNSREYFEKYLHRKQLASHYLYNCLEKLA